MSQSHNKVCNILNKFPQMILFSIYNVYIHVCGLNKSSKYNNYLLMNLWDCLQLVLTANHPAHTFVDINTQISGELGTSHIHLYFACRMRNVKKKAMKLRSSCN